MYVSMLRLLLTGTNSTVKKNVILNCNNISQYYSFTVFVLCLVEHKILILVVYAFILRDR